MNYPIMAAGVIVFVAFLVHTIVGNRETFSTRPVSSGDDSEDQTRAVERNWVQSFCAFQLVTVDLFAFSILLFALGASDFLPARPQIALAAGCFFTLWGLVWLVQLLLLRRPGKDYLALSQWFFWFICAGLLFWGGRTL